MPRSILMNVVLPAPFSPMRPKQAPPGTSRSMPATACTLPNAFIRPREDTANVGGGTGMCASAEPSVGAGVAAVVVTWGVASVMLHALARERSVEQNPAHDSRRALGQR